MNRLNTKFFASLISVFLLLILILPVFLFAQPYLPGQEPNPYEPFGLNSIGIYDVPGGNIPNPITEGPTVSSSTSMPTCAAPNKGISSSFTPLITCGNTPCAGPDGKIKGGCTFEDFIATINRIINWIISIAGVIFTIMAVYGGFLYMTSGDKPGNKEKAKSILLSTLTGFVIILVSWLIVYTIVHTLVDSTQEGSILKFLK